jgi:uncharacterized membrane protein
MWFLGLVLGLIFGGLSSGAWGAAFGAFLGAIAGWGLGKLLGIGGASAASAEMTANTAAINAHLARLQKAVEDIHWRLARIESSEKSEKNIETGEVVAPVVVPAVTSAITSAVTSAVSALATAAPATAWGREAGVQVSDNSLSSIDNERDALVTATNESAARIQATAEILAAANASVPPTPDEPIKPNPLWAWLTGGNTIVRVGVLILFIGMAFLVKYAAENAMFPLELRLAAVGAGAIALLVIGWRLRLHPTHAGYALTLQGAGVAILYLTIFSAFRLYNLIPAALAFPLLVAVAAFSTLLAIRQDALSLAVTGVAGGFLAPILASTGQGSHVALFSYYAVLNAGIFCTAWVRAWRPLNLVGFVFTFAIAAAWGSKYYAPSYFATTEPFLILFFVAYVAIAILYAFKQAPKLTHYVDGTLIFGAPIVGFGLQAGLVSSFEFGMAFSALALAAFYLLLATWLKAKHSPQLKLLIESFLVLGVIFATLAIPLALDARWTSAVWAIEGAAVFWVGVRQDRKLARAFGLLMQLLAGIAFLLSWQSSPDSYPILNSQFIGYVLLAASGFYLNRLIHRNQDAVTTLEWTLSPILFVWGGFWWLTGSVNEIYQHIALPYHDAAQVALIVVSVLVSSIASMKLRWREAAWPQRLLLPALLLAAFNSFTQYHGDGAAPHLFAALGWLVWPLAIAVNYWLLHLHEPTANIEAEEKEKLSPHYFALLHAATMLFVAAIGATEIHWLTTYFDLQKSAWSVAAVMLIPCALLLAVCSAMAQAKWPISSFAAAYQRYAGGVIVAALCLWSLYANFTHNGASAPLPYLPVMNAIDLGHLFILLTLLIWWRRVNDDDNITAFKPLLMPIAGALIFIWLNAILLRTLHHWAGVDFALEAMMRSVLVQAALSIFWTVLALSLMLLAARLIERRVWFIGAALMAVVVGKLFFVDLSNLAGVERIVSFIGVGVLMLVVGYVAPVPPAIVRSNTDDELNTEKTQ